MLTTSLEEGEALGLAGGTQLGCCTQPSAGSGSALGAVLNALMWILVCSECETHPAVIPAVLSSSRASFPCTDASELEEGRNWRRSECFPSVKLGGNWPVGSEVTRKQGKRMQACMPSYCTSSASSG